MKRHTILMLVTILITALVSCSYENTATVTIDTGIRQQAQLNLFDRVLAFLSLSQPLQADPVPGPLVGQVINKIYVYITSSDIDTITKEIPLETGRITLEVPAGNQRTFTVVAGYQSVGANIFEKNYGGIITVDLSPGQQVNLNIEMGKLPIINYPFYDTAYKRIIINSNNNYDISAFVIYKTVNGVITKLNTVTNFTTNCSGECQYSFLYDLGDIDTEYCYENAVYISGVNKYGEGDNYGLSNCM